MNQYSDNSQMLEFQRQMQSAQLDGAESAQRHDAALQQMADHMALVRQAMRDPLSLLQSTDPLAQQLLRARAGSLSAALRVSPGAGQMVPQQAAPSAPQPQKNGFRKHQTPNLQSKSRLTAYQAGVAADNGED